MRLTVSEVKINIPKHLAKVNDNRFWLYAAQQWHRLYSPYVPMRTGMLMNTVRITPHQVEHTVPYAAAMYNGRFNFRKDQHPLASREWDKAAKATQLPKLVRSLQGYVDSGRLKLNG